MRVCVGGASRSPLASPTGEEKRLVRPWRLRQEKRSAEGARAPWIDQ
jgi:hypothetical protein